MKSDICIQVIHVFFLDKTFMLLLNAIGGAFVEVLATG